MKKVIAIISLCALIGNIHLKSQDIPPPNPGLVINIVTGFSIEFDFDELFEYQNGIGGSVSSGPSTFIRIGAIYDWKLQFKADELTFIGSTGTMELNNLGLVIESTGTNQDDGSNIINNAKYSPLALESSDVTVMTKGTLTNKGYGIENSFTLKWEMGTKQGNMNPVSIFDQLISGVIEPDTYTVNVILTLSVH